MQSININTAMKWLTSEQALRALGVRPQTLYANVSRGRIRTKPDTADSRRSLYHGADIERLAGRKEGRKSGRRAAETVATQAIGWGDPVLASAISTVAEGRLWYQGRDAIALADQATLEDIASLLWQTGSIEAGVAKSPAKSGKSDTPLRRILVAMSERAATDPPSRGRSPAVLKAEAETLLGLLVETSLGEPRSALPTHALPIHAGIAAAWRRPKAKDLIRRALVLLADHELNASTFAVRIAASTGASLSACLLAGLTTLTGPLHGGAAHALRSLLRATRQGDATEAVREWLARGEMLPAFGHPLYPDGDPRAIALMAEFKLSPVFAQIRAAAEDLTGERPNVDFALAALADAHGLPEQAPFVIFAISRSIGWMAHALEQIATGQLIRPRARYIGPALAQENS